MLLPVGKTNVQAITTNAGTLSSSGSKRINSRLKRLGCEYLSEFQNQV